MKIVNQSILLIKMIALLGILSSCEYENEEELFAQSVSEEAEECETENVTYTDDILPILTTHCYTCHDEKNRFGNVVLEGLDNVRIYAGTGQLLGSISHEPGYSPMPDNGGKLPDCEIETVRKWIETGTPQ